MRDLCDEAMSQKMSNTETREKQFLTERENVILHRIAEGRSSQQIADELGLANETVKWYRKRMLAKFQVASSLEMVVKAMEMQIL
jgi:DNA-binding NarL/FixJ family response regulator